MIQHKPYLALSRLTIMKAGKPAYDERFHFGVNIIRGENSTGKSSIANMIFFALGGEAPRWTDAVLQCDVVMAEVLLNGTAITLRREISTDRGRPMFIYWGTYDEASHSAVEGWQEYPYAKTKNRHSFSTVLFRALGLPEVRGEHTSNLTIHQLLRLMYVDQLTPPTQIFRDDGPFDKFQIRDAVGSMLCGVYDDRIYDIRRELQARATERDMLDKELKAVFSVLSESNQAEEPDAIRALITQRQDMRTQTYLAIEDLRKSVWERKQVEQVQKKALEELGRQLSQSKHSLRSAEAELAGLEYEIEDSELFITSLERRIGAVDDSESVRGALGSVTFSLCPLCFSQIDAPTTDGKCPLCKSDVSNTAMGSQLLRLQQEMSLQLDESRRLQQERQNQKAALLKKLPLLRSAAKALQSRYDSEARNITPVEDMALAEKYRELGSLDKDIEGLQARLRLAVSIEKMKTRSTDLAAEIARLEAELDQRRQSQNRKQHDAYILMQRHTLSFLKKDLAREEAFEGGKSFTFSFEKDSMAVDGHSNFSASSLVILKNTFHLAILAASLEAEFFRYPRFLLIDNIEDKGMEPLRSHRFQENVAALSQDIDVQHQIIFTTSMISPSLDKEPYVVGPKYSHDCKVLTL